MKIPSLLLVSATLYLAGSSAFANSLLFSGDTTSAPTYNRATADGLELSLFGTEVPYYVEAFTVSLNGNYDLTVVADEPGSYDTFLHLYSGSFNPASPLDSILLGNDDATLNPADGSALTGQSLLAGTTYYMVISGFGDTDFGAFDASISGLGDILVVPEPSTYALAGLGLAGLVVMRRRKSVHA